MNVSKEQIEIEIGIDIDIETDIDERGHKLLVSLLQYHRMKRITQFLHYYYYYCYYYY